MSKKKVRHSPEQIVRELRGADAMLNTGQDVAAVLQALEGVKRPTTAGGTSMAG